jgi:hypothetical protein
VLVKGSRVLTLDTDDEGREGIAVFTSREKAEEVSPEGYRALYIDADGLLKLSEALHVWLVALIGLEGHLEGSILTVDVFTAALEGEM